MTTSTEHNVDKAVNAQEILEKFDRESVTRNPKNRMVNYLIAAIAIFYSLFHVYITFSPLPELVQRSVHVSVGLALIFLLYPASQKGSRSSVAWYDWLWVLASMLGAGYLIW